MKSDTAQTLAERRRETVPGRSLTQRRAALASANAIRFARARLKRELKHDRGLARIVELVVDPDVARSLLPPDEAARAPDGFAHGFKLADALEASAGIGPVKRAAILRHADASPSKTLAGLTARQRASVVGELLVIRRRRGYGPIKRSTNR